MGYFFVFLGVLAITAFIIFHYQRVEQKRWKKIVFLLHSFLFLGAGIYFIGFFLGKADHFGMLILSYIAGTFVGVSLYSTILLLFQDIIFLLCKKKRTIRTYNFIFLIAFAITISGFINAKDIVITNYQLTIEKKEATIKSLHLAFIGDLHIGSNIRKKEIDTILQKVKKLNPELLIFNGDIFDEGTPQRLKDYFIEQLKTIQPPFGSYYILGNHELNRPHLVQELKEWEQVGVKMLSDQKFLIQNQFYLIGRKDRKQKRSSLQQLVQNSKNLPIILIEHRPFTLENQNLPIDLQLSAHTHNGQIIPFQAFDFITHQKTYGKYQQKNQQMIVTSGAGTWGIPLRMGSHSEIVAIKIQFH